MTTKPIPFIDHKIRLGSKKSFDLLGTLWCTLLFLIPFNTVVENSELRYSLQAVLLLSLVLIIRAVTRLRAVPVLALIVVSAILALPYLLGVRTPYIVVLIFFSGAAIAADSSYWPDHLRGFMIISAVLCLVEYVLKNPGLWESSLHMTHIFYNGGTLRAAEL